MKTRLLVLIIVLCGLTACSGIYYSTMERLGVHKRDIMVDRVKQARDSQQEAKEQFLTAMEQFRSVVHFKGGDLEAEYRKLSATLQESEARAAEVSRRIRAVEDVSETLFREWKSELDDYASESLREASRRKYEQTRKQYDELIGAMKAAEARLEPALIPLRDQVLFIKHNLNARAIAGLTGELAGVQSNVDDLVREMEHAIARADEFIASIEQD